MKNVKILLIGMLIFCHALSQKQNDTSSVVWQHGYLDIHHINTGRGVSSFFIFPDGTTMMVDAGDLDDTNYNSPSARSWPLTITQPYPDDSKNSGEWLVDYIKQVYPSVQKIDYALITHFHGDHMGVIKPTTLTSKNGGYRLSGITQVGELLPVKKMIDRSYPENIFPVALSKYYKEQPSIFNNYELFIEYQKTHNGLHAESLAVGSINQLVLKNQPSQFPGFFVRGIKSNGTIWTGKGDETVTYFTKDSVIDIKGNFNENPLSLAIKLSYGKFDYFTGGDNTGLQGDGQPSWFDVETPIAKGVGMVEVTTLDHHGNRDGTNANFLKSLQPQVVVEQTWCSDHPGQEVMHRLVSNHLYPGEKNIFATNIQESTQHTLGFWFTRAYKSMFGHVIIRVLPGGDTYYVLIAETLKSRVTIKKVFGPFYSR